MVTWKWKSVYTHVYIQQKCRNKMGQQRLEGKQLLGIRGWAFKPSTNS